VATGELDVGGLVDVVAFLARRLSRHGVLTAVAYTGERVAGRQGNSGRLTDELRAEGIECELLDPDNAVAWLESWRPDVVSAHGAPDWLMSAANQLDVPWVETLHGSHSVFDPESIAVENGRVRHIAAQIAVSELVREQYAARVPAFPVDRLVTVPNGLDEARLVMFDRAQAREALGVRDEFLFVSLARHSLQKNTFGLVTAFDEVARRQPDAHLLIAGRADDPYYYQQVRRQVDASAHADRIHLRGHCTSPSALLAAADAFVLDSFFEGWALASMEALVNGVPVVMSDVGGAREQLRGGGRGYLVGNPAGAAEQVDWAVISSMRFKPQPNRAELVDAMSALVVDRAAWAARRADLRAEAVGDFRADACLAGHANVLLRVAAGAPLGAA
jgi:glycosyltransferase involved in cell wall biosynthesis